MNAKIRKRKWNYFLLGLVLPLLIVSCSEAPVEVGNPNNNEDAAFRGTLVLEDGSAASGADVTIESHPEYTTTADKNGNFQFINIDPGVYTVYATIDDFLSVKSSAGERAIDTNQRAAQIKDVVVVADVENVLEPNGVLTIPGSISANIGLVNNPQNVELVGIDVYIPGTSYTAKSDASGNVVLSNVPAGTYTVRFEKDGLTSFEVEDVIVTSNQDTNLNTINLSLSVGPSGQITGFTGSSEMNIGGDDKTVVNSTDVTVKLLYDSSAVLMKLAHESSFLNVDWVPVSETYTFTSENNSSAYSNFQSDGQKTVYVKFSDLNGQESSVYTKQLVIDAAGPNLSSFKVLYGWDTVKQDAPSVPMEVYANDSGSGIAEVMFSNDAGFATNSGWVSYEVIVDAWALTAGSGSKTVYAKVRDYSGNESSTASDDIDADTYTLMTCDNATYFCANVEIPTGISPVRWEQNVFINSNLTIEENVDVEFHGGVDSAITIFGAMFANGTAGNEITFTTPGASIVRIDIRGTGSDINYVTASAVSVTQEFILIADGTIDNFVMTDDGAGNSTDYGINMQGSGDVMITNANISMNIRSCIGFTSGTGNLTIEYSTLSCQNSFHQDGGTGAVARYNTFNANGFGGQHLTIDTGDFTMEYNNFASTPNIASIRMNSVGEITAFHNNLTSGQPHYWMTDGTVDSTFNHYPGGISVTGAGVTDDGYAGGAWVTTGSSADCVGAACDP